MKQTKVSRVQITLTALMIPMPMYSAVLPVGLASIGNQIIMVNNYCWTKINYDYHNNTSNFNTFCEVSCSGSCLKYNDEKNEQHLAKLYDILNTSTYFFCGGQSGGHWLRCWLCSCSCWRRWWYSDCDCILRCRCLSITSPTYIDSTCAHGCCLHRIQGLIREYGGRICSPVPLQKKEIMHLISGIGSMGAHALGAGTLNAFD